MGPYTRTLLSAATAAVANRYVTSTNMKVGAYTLANATPPTAGARKVTVTNTTVTGADTLGTIDVVGKDLQGVTITESITPLAGTIATGSKWFASIISITGVGWVINTGNDTITVGVGADVIVAEGSGTLYAVVVNATAAGTITLADQAGTIAVLKASIAENTYYYECAFSGYLSVALAAASNVTVIHSPSALFTFAP